MEEITVRLSLHDWADVVSAIKFVRSQCGENDFLVDAGMEGLNCEIYGQVTGYPAKDPERERVLTEALRRHPILSRRVTMLAPA